MKRYAMLCIIPAALLLPWLASTTSQAQPSLGRPILGAPVDLEAPRAASDKVLQAGPIQMHPPRPSSVNLPSPALESTDLPLPINLAAALRLADARPLVVAAAQASAWQAEAQLAYAKVLWIPTLNLGVDYYRHQGLGPDLNHGINTAAMPLDQNISFMYAGGGFTNMNQTTDMIFGALAARQVLKSRRFDIQTAKNDVLLDTATAYFEIHRYRGKYAGAVDVVQRGQELIKLLVEQTKDLIPKVEVNRAVNALEDFKQQAASAREEWRVQSANFTQILRLDPRTVVVPIEPDHLQVTIIDPARPLDELMPIGLTNRPELASQQALVKAVVERIRQEKFRPLLPSLLLNGFQTPYELLQFGAQGIGQGSAMNLWSFRDDFSIQPVWQLDAMGLGNLAKIKEQRAIQSRTLVDLLKAQDAVAAEVTRAQARLQSAAVRVLQADRSVREALITFDGNYRGLKQTTRNGPLLIQVYRPQEAVVALEHLKTAYDQYFSTVADYNKAQFQLFHALGYPAAELTNLRSPGEPSAVDPNRPGYLPPVGTGPPPATR